MLAGIEDHLMKMSSRVPLLLLSFYAFVSFEQGKSPLRSHQYPEVLSDLTLLRINFDTSVIACDQSSFYFRY